MPEPEKWFPRVEVLMIISVILLVASVIILVYPRR